MTIIFDAPAPICTVAEPPLGAVGAIIVTPDNRFLMQLRDDKPGIWLPNSWSLFGGAIEPGETPGEALKRELLEELNFTPREIRYFTQIAWDFAAWGLGIKLRYAFIVPIESVDVAGLILAEGQEMRLVPAIEALRLPRLAPYDAHALGLYIEEAPVGMAPRIG
ncbi:MAG: NUDIX hydrolase [Alphaproteobacteria bacterium]